MKLALAQVATLNAPFAADLEDYAAAKCPAIEIWFGKLETYLESHSVDDVRRLLETHEIEAPVASFQGGLFVARDDARREAWDLLARRLELCQQLAVRTMVVVADLVSSHSQNDFDRLLTLLRQAAEAVEQHDVRLAIEFQSSALFCNNLQTVLTLVDQVGSHHLGICFDMFHYQTGPSKPEDLTGLTAENLVHVQLSDVAGTPRELATDADRVLPGDGDFVFEPVLQHLENIQYAGHISVELMNPRIWQIPPLSYAEIAMTALRKLLGLT